MRADIVPGATFPDDELSDHTAHRRELSELQGPHPTVLVLSRGFFGRPTLEDLRQDLRAVLQTCQPDRDITTPALRAAWAEGKKELFYPSGKTFVQTLGEQD